MGSLQDRRKRIMHVRQRLGRGVALGHDSGGNGEVTVCPPPGYGPGISGTFRRIHRLPEKGLPLSGYNFTVTVFTSVYACNPYSPSSRPMPERLNPPKGAAASKTS